LSTPSSPHWSGLYERRDRLGPPLRPDRDVVVAYKSLLTGHSTHVLLFGVTPALADLGSKVVAVDKNDAAIARAWPGNNDRRRVHQGDWLALPFPARSFSAALGDGCLNALPHPMGYAALYEQLERVLAPGSPFITRIYMAPDKSESVASVMAQAMAGRIDVFNAFKLRIAMAAAAERGSPNIEVRLIRDAFNRVCPDRPALGAAARWDAETIAMFDVYENSEVIYSFPTLAELRATISAAFVDVRVVAAGAYALAERCPLVVMKRAQ